MEDNLLSVSDLSKHYIVKKNIFSKKKLIKAVDNISFDIKRGETLGLIGESGSGKSTTASLILRLVNPDGGKIIYGGQDITDFDRAQMRDIRKNMQMVFQQSQEALDPKMTIEEILIEPLRIFNIVEKHEYNKEVKRLLELVGISEESKNKFPHQLSGGQRQRIGIARAISTGPDFIVLDEPVSALDVSVQGQILNLLQDIREELNLTYLFISHDIRVITHICDRIAVMFKGGIVEIGKREDIILRPRDEYTKKLLGSVL